MADLLPKRSIVLGKLTEGVGAEGAPEVLLKLSLKAMRLRHIQQPAVQCLKVTAVPALLIVSDLF